MTSTDIVDETAAVVERPTFQNRHPQLEAAARAIATLTTKEYAQDEIWEEDLELFYKQFARNERTSPMTAAWEALQSVERLSRERDTGVPEGWQLVPKEPTDGMLQNFEDEYWMHFATTPPNPWTVGEKLYRAMLSAAPQPPAGSDQAGEIERWQHIAKQGLAKCTPEHTWAEWVADRNAENDRLSAELVEARKALEAGERVIHEACRVVDADTYKHPILSRAEAVAAGVAGLHDAVRAWQSAQSAESVQKEVTHDT